MAAGVKIRTEFSAAELRRLAAAPKHANQSRRLLSIAAVLDGMSRADAARIGGNAKLRRAVKTRGHFPTDEAAIKLLYLVLRDVATNGKCCRGNGAKPRPNSPSFSTEGS